jgi:protein-S-isoprenylcysteine O-methyltransferase Ste14
MSLTLLLFTALTAVLFLGAAVWAEGGASAFFASAPLAAFFWVSVALFVASAFTRANVSSGLREDRSNRWVLVGFTVIGTFGGDGVRWLGVAVYAVGGALRLAPVFVLGKRFSGLVAIQEGHRLVTGGLYGVIRHPSYLGLLLGSAGLALVFRSLPALAIAALMLIPLVGRIAAEERLLAETFGEEYEAYRARTWRLVPGVW